MTAIDDMVLIPRPRSVEALGGSVSAGEVDVESSEHPSIRPQGYWLTIDRSGIRIDHRDGAGLRHARQTLDQIRAQSPDGQLPAVRIEDHPDFLTRGLMLDISRDRVPTKATLTRFVELASLARINQLQLYTEHTFSYSQHREVWRDASPMTAAHIAWLDEECREHGIELVANQNCFGHMERWLAHDSYRARAECPDGWELIPGVRRPPSVLAPTEDNAAFAIGLLDEMLPHFRSRRVNIGCDEPFELGRGASRAEVEERGLGRVYLDHVRRIADPLLADGREVQIWADVLRRHPELAADLPEGLVPIAWCYEAPTPDGSPPVPPEVTGVLETLGIDAATFAGFGPTVAPLAEAGVDFWVSPGTSSWNSFVGRSDNARANLVDAAETGIAHGSRGYLITDWGDNGHLQPPSVSFGPILLGGCVSWALESNRDLDLIEALSTHVFHDGSGQVAEALDLLGQQWGQTGRRAINASPLHAAVFPDQVHLVMGEADPEQLHPVVADIETAMAALGSAEAACADAPQVGRELAQAARLARHGAWRLLGADGPSADTLADDMADIVETQLVVWLDRARPGGLTDSLARLDPSFASQVAIPVEEH